MATIPPKAVRLKRHAVCTIRVAFEADAPAMLEHQAHMALTDPHTVSEPGEKRRTLAEQTELILKHREEPGSLMLVAIEGEDASIPAAVAGRGMLMGALAFHAGDRRKVRHHGHFGISVHADWRGTGVGSALIKALLDWARAHEHLEKVCLGVFEINAGARRLYERLGFRVESRAPNFFKLGPGRYVADLWMAIYVKPGVAPEGFLTWGA
jgi:RimJ/RimL family protein N-acetyltransferase